MNKVYQNVFLYSINVSYVLYFIVLLGISGFAPQYLEYLRSFLKFYIALLLIFLYNPYTYKARTFGEFDRKLVFSSAIFLLLSTTAISGIEEYLRMRSQYLIQSGVKLLI